MRLFIAIKTSCSVSKAVEICANNLSLFGKGSFYTKDMYHITLAFIGEHNGFSDIITAMQSINCTPFEVQLNTLGNFGDTYYVSANKSYALNSLQQQITNALATVGINTENRSFLPHITIARHFKANMPPYVFVPPASMIVKEICLYESKNGVYYTVYTKVF